tara:strand:- start:29360 stop:29767 length:408 start_codon:yes stop_codon:yes gene_type:complete
MRTKNTFSILFWVHPTRVKNIQTSIFTKITVNGKRANISLKLQVGIGLWDSNKQRAKGNSNEVREINNYLNQLYSKIVQIYQDLKYKEKLISAVLLKAYYLGEAENSKKLQEILKYHNRFFEVIAKGPREICLFG